MKHMKTALVIAALGGVAVGSLATFAVPRLGAVSATAGGMCDGMMGGGMMGGNGMRDMMRGMMGGALPPGTDPDLLPEPRSEGARLLDRFCTQCHDLPGPGLHTVGEWPRVVERMHARMRMMDGMMNITAPASGELRTLLAYLQKHAQRPIDRSRYPDLDTRAGKSFAATCSQCHALPDPAQHTAGEWPGVVQRMKGHMAATGKFEPGETETAEIVAFLQRHGKERE